MNKLKFSEVLSRLGNLRRGSDGGYTARCPAHDDRRNSLSLREKSDGGTLFYCHAGCPFENIVNALETSPGGVSTVGETEIVYDYKDEAGKTLYQNVRSAGKEFRWRRIDENGRVAWNLNGARRVPYHLPELLKLTELQDVLMTEGEKDADALARRGFPATNHKNWTPEFNYLLKGKNVIIFRDHDRPGFEQAEKAARIVYRDAKAVKVVDCFPNEPVPEKHGKDVSDFLQTHSLDELRELIRRTPVYQPSAEVSSTDAEGKDRQGFRVVRLFDVEEKEIDWLWKPFIALGEFTILEGIEGQGKSWLCGALACAVAGGKRLPFHDAPVMQGNVLLLSAEDSLSHTVKPRLISMRADTTKIFAIDEVFSLDNIKDLIKFEEIIAEYNPILIIIDPMFSYTGGKNLNAESDSRPIARKLIAIAQKFGCAIIGVRHLGKAKGNGDARAAGLGSVAWRASARSVLLVGGDEETGEKAVCQTKNNLAQEAGFSVGFRIENGQFFWESEPSRLTKEKILAQPKDDEAKAEQTEAVAFLRDALSGGERPSAEIERDARSAGVTNYGLKKAKRLLGVESFKKGGTFGGERCWFMRMPSAEDEQSEIEESDNFEFRPIQSNDGDKTVSGNNLVEEVENRRNQRLQASANTSSSNGSVPEVRVAALCRCSSNGFVGEDCPSCGEMIIPF